MGSLRQDWDPRQSAQDGRLLISQQARPQGGASLSSASAEKSVSQAGASRSALLGQGLNLFCRHYFSHTQTVGGADDLSQVCPPEWQVRPSHRALFVTLKFCLLSPVQEASLFT